jgi:hypothetical protein
MKDFDSVAVFCGASDRVEQHFLDESYKLGQMISELGLTLVYGGAQCGAMGAVANGSLKAGGKVIGVFPSNILDDIEEPHQGLTELVITADMHTRKVLMFERSDLFIITPGGFGTMDEAFEIITLKYLGANDKPIYFYNYQGYFDSWVTMVDSFIEHKFAKPDVANTYEVFNDFNSLEAQLKKLSSYKKILA